MGKPYEHRGALYQSLQAIALSVGHDAHLAIQMYELLDRLPQEGVVASSFSAFRKGYPSQCFRL